MKKIFLLLVLILFMVAVALPTAVLASGEQASGANVDRLAAAIERLADLYEDGRKQVEAEALTRKLDTAIAYLNFRSRRIERLEQDLQELRTMRDRMDTFLVKMEETRQIEDAQTRSSVSISDDEAEKRRQEHELTMKMMQERIDRTDREIVTVENTIQDLQEELSSVESFVQRNLEF